MATSLRGRVLRALLALAGALVVAVAGLAAFVAWRGDRRFDLPPTGIAATADPAVVARGEYLFHGPMHCSACHAGGGMAAYRAAGPGDRLEAWGGQQWRMGPLATLRAANLTSDPETGLGALSDEQIARAVTHGVRRDGRLGLFMSLAVGTAADEDVRAVVSYVRTLPPRRHAVPPSELGPVGRALVAFGVVGPRVQEPPPFVREGSEPSVERGRYLSHGPALCATCHSPVDLLGGARLKGAWFSGCYEAEPVDDDPTLELCAPNITAHPEAGRLAGWTEEAFVARMQAGTGPSESIMPWLNYSAMTEADLRSVFRYLATVEPSPRDPGPPVRPRGWKPAKS